MGFDYTESANNRTGTNTGTHTGLPASTDERVRKTAVERETKKSVVSHQQSTNKSFASRLQYFINRKVNVSRTELLAT